ncbi:STAS domain-containing protein [Desulfococcaceae bacterium HSG7]|nr:STAS domain-containing protein [Desulfococcaceae bacterium HSG7]
MLIAEKNSDECAHVVVQSSMTVYEAEKLCKEWASYLKKGDACTGVCLDLKNVSDCDITGVQLLCSARKTADLNHKILIVSEASKTVIKAVSDAGLEPDELFTAA